MMSTESGPTSAPYPTKWRRNLARCRTGCLTCRQRKKKCDEVHPQCTGCIRNRLECTWPTPPPPPAVGNSMEVSPPADRAAEQVITIAWSEPLQSFSSIAKASLMTPQSSILLRHYLVELGPSLVPAPLSKNPFVSVVLPLAYVDDLVMQCVVALGGANLCFKLPNNPEIQATMTSHYFCVVRSLRIAFQDLDSMDTSKVLRILLVLIMIANFEAFAGNCFNGEIFPHLRASRQLITWLLHEDHSPTSKDDKFLLGFLLESYAYLVVVNSFCPPGELNRVIQHDDFLNDLSLLNTYPSFGIFFDGCHGLMEIIPRITDLATRRLAEESSAPVSQEVTSFSQAIAARIASWQRPGTNSSEDPEDDENISLERQAIAECYRHALLLYLDTSMAGSITWDVDHANSVQHHIQAIAGLVISANLQGSRYAAIIMWPLLIAGSCLIYEEQRSLLTGVLRESDSSTWNSACASKFLEMLWEERLDDERMFGPYGLYLTMKKRGLNFCMA